MTHQKNCICRDCLTGKIDEDTAQSECNGGLSKLFDVHVSFICDAESRVDAMTKVQDCLKATFTGNELVSFDFNFMVHDAEEVKQQKLLKELRDEQIR